MEGARPAGGGTAMVDFSSTAIEPYSPHLNFVRSSSERALEKQQQQALMASGVVATAVY